MATLAESFNKYLSTSEREPSDQEILDLEKREARQSDLNLCVIIAYSGGGA